MRQVTIFVDNQRYVDLMARVRGCCATSFTQMLCAFAPSWPKMGNRQDTKFSHSMTSSHTMTGHFWCFIKQGGWATPTDARARLRMKLYRSFLTVLLPSAENNRTFSYMKVFKVMLQ